ncbi:GvpL/GvpF family gas vesicle protein [Embleya sp. NPDC008237]|uniref:GvpL/GvpF family gas vesicle protein n=1 Tax=Embleya sp. NPDC008237 TaxID=3363978 RepID=UPI0036E58662
MTTFPGSAFPSPDASFEGVDSACYVYGLVPAGTALPPDAVGVGHPASAITLVEHDAVAAVVGEVSVEQPLGTPEDLRTHARVLDGLAASTTVLPFRFGTVLRDVRCGRGTPRRTPQGVLRRARGTRREGAVHSPGSIRGGGHPA